LGSLQSQRNMGFKALTLPFADRKRTIQESDREGGRKERGSITKIDVQGSQTIPSEHFKGRASHRCRIASVRGSGIAIRFDL
jgi:hypothetical protein